jgi:D-3-phosphoglycerate dehydrogenase
VRLLVADSLDSAGLDLLRSVPGLEVDYRPQISAGELTEAIGGYEGILIRSRTRVGADLLEAAHRLKVVGRAGVGVDNVDVEAASRRGVVVMNTPLANAVTTAEHTISLMLSLARQIPQATASIKAGKWEKGKFLGVEVYRKTLGLVGLGNIGRIVAKRALGLEMEVIAHDPFTRERAEGLGVRLVDLNTLYARSHFISLHVPVTEGTRNLIDAAAIARMRDGVRIINCARGGIVDEAALAEALRSGKVAGAALDVFRHEPVEAGNPLLPLESVICTPHLGAATVEAQENVSTAIAQQLADYFGRGVVTNAVNMPSLDPETMARLRPYLNLASRLGLFLGQLMDSGVREIRFTYAGEAASLDVRPISMAFIEGILRPILKEAVNQVNAPYLARERGIKVSETRREKAEIFSSTLEAAMVTEQGEQCITGTIFHGGAPRIVRLDGFDLEASPEGTMLVFRNEDRPGVIGRIGTILGDAGINIASFDLGRVTRQGMAVAIVGIDSDIPEGIMARIRELPFIRMARQVKL